MDELRILLIVVGAAILLGMYVWGTRKNRLGGQPERQRRAARQGDNEPSLPDGHELPEPDAGPPVASSDATAELSKTPPPDNVRTQRRSLSSISSNPATASSTAVPATSNSTASATGHSPTARPMAPKPKPSTSTPPVAANLLKDKPSTTRINPFTRSKIEPTATAPTRPTPAGRSETVLLTVIPPAGQLLSGVQILRAANEFDLKLSRSGVLDCLVATNQGSKILFSIGHLREPGTFAPEEMHTLETPGLLLFMRIPGPSPDLKSADMFFTVANQLAQNLGGQIADEQRQVLDQDALIRVYQNIVSKERRLRGEQL